MDFTYELPDNFKKRVYQFLGQLKDIEVANAFNRCAYEYDDAGFAVAVSNAMKTVNQLDFSGLYEAVSRFAEVSKMMQPASENARKLAALISDELKISIESANKSANSDEKSANKSADNMTVLTKRQEQILTIMEEGREYTTEAIAGIIGLKGPRTRQLMNELVELGKVESLGTTKDRRYRKK